MKRVVVLGTLFLSVFFSVSILSKAWALNPPSPIGNITPPVPELIPDSNSKPLSPLKIDDPSSPPISSSELTPPAKAEEDLQDQDLGTPPLVIKPSREEIKEKVILELKELETGGTKDITASFDFPIVINEQVEYFIDYFQSKLRNRFSLWMGRSTRFMSLMKQILREYNLPEDLVYLAMIESGFSTKAYSRAHAVGPWQFIRETGARYGLRINSWIDERKDPVKSTRAAAQYLADLYARFGSWYLAAAGYNAGENKITRALAKYNASNFWEISADHCHYIKEETKQYVPKMIAAALIAKEPEKYGFSKIDYQPPLAFDVVSIPGNVELKDVASAVGTDVETIVELNPELKRWVTPPGAGEYSIRIPRGTREKLMENYAELTKPKPRVIYAEHRVKKGERLSSISRRYGVKASVIARVNRINSHRRLQTGLVLLIPKKSGASSESELNERQTSEGKKANHPLARTRKGTKTQVASKAGNEKENRLLRLRYKIKKGDSFSSIAEKFDVEISMIKKWNNRKGGSKIQAGKILTLYVPRGQAEGNGHKENSKSGKSHLKKPRAETPTRIRHVLYIVKKGDCLSEIAQKFNTTPEQIRNWNRLSAREIIRPGDKLSLKIKRPNFESI